MRFCSAAATTRGQDAALPIPAMKSRRLIR
jgi:hypothetical protein